MLQEVRVNILGKIESFSENKNPEDIRKIQMEILELKNTVKKKKLNSGMEGTEESVNLEKRLAQNGFLPSSAHQG